MWFGAYRRDSVRKRQERANEINTLSPSYRAPFTIDDKKILDTPISQLAQNVQNKVWKPTEVLVAYGKKAIQVHERVNCITEILIPSAETWAAGLWDELDKVNGNDVIKSKPLFGVPISLKDTVSVAGYDQAIGYTSRISNPATYSSPLVQLLLDAGALPFVKSTVPTTLLSFESSSALFGTTRNPHNYDFTPGGSSGGEAALLAAGGSRVGFGTDVAGSVRLPAHWSGVYAVRGSVGRFPRSGNATSLPGQEGVASVVAPMARTLEDLESVWKAVVGMKPWAYDYSCLQIPWREVILPEKLKFGVMWGDGVVPPSPACLRALNMVMRELRAAGHEVVDFTPPDVVEGLRIGSQLLFADGGKTIHAPLLAFEPTDPGMSQAAKYLSLPGFLKSLYTFYIRRIRHDPLYASFLDGFRGKTVAEFWALIASREAWKAKWTESWKNSGVDFLLTVPNALPAVRHGGMKKGWRVCGYTFLFNIVDYTAGVLPITHVSSILDQLPPLTSPSHPYNLYPHIPRNAIADGAYEMYDAVAMHGLPVGVQVVAGRLQEEKVIEGMKIVKGVMERSGHGYEGLEVEVQTDI